ncbi:uncharacterized protein [Asterias amurensis]|uniref:uncharacterized protein isoform X4 n=1 Tax=Asterias amurensis TaxID=7602 RepID=UPI003AB47B7F
MASPPRSVRLLKQQFEGDKKAKVPVRRNRSSNDLYVNVASTTTNNQQQIPAAGSTSRKCTGVNLPKDGSGRAFMLVSSPPAGRVQKPKFLPSGSSPNKHEVCRLSTTSITRKTSGNAADKSESSNLLKKPKLPAKPKDLEFRMKHRSMSLDNFYTRPSVKKDDDNSTTKDSDLSLQESSQQVEEDESRPLCVSERVKRFGGEDRRRKPHQPPETRTPDTGLKFGGISSDKWGRSLSTDNEDNDEHDKRIKVKTEAELPLLTTASVECDDEDRVRVDSVSDVTHGDSDIDNDTDNEECIVKPGADIGNGSSVTPEGSVIPLSQNPLLLVQDETPMPEIQRRRSSLHDDIHGTTSISNARGLFQKALKVSSSEPLQTTEKPPVPTKPKILKKPIAAVNNSATTPIVKNGQSNVSPKLECPKRHNAARFNPSKQETPMESNNIYDDVYQEAPSPPDTAIPKLNRSSKKLEQFFGQEVPEAGDDNSATTNVGKSIKRLSDKDGPYAIIPIPDVDKTAAKNSNITNGNGQAVLRNSGGMSSGDSGVLMHSDLLGQERKLRTRDRRMSRRILRRQMRSMDSDFAEDSDDDEPIGTASDFDSDASEDTLEDVIPEPVQFLDDTHKKAYEVLTTERTYVKNLYLIDQIFFARITQENQKHSWFPPTVPMEIFSNISTIYRLHSDVILCALEKQLKEWETNPCLGEVLKDNAHFLKLYSFYVGNFNHAMKQLNSWTSKVPKFAAAISELQQLPECGGLALQHHMLTPVQRIPRYELLLKEYLRKLPEDARDRPSAEKALGIISGAAKHSNDMMKSMEQFEKLLKINEKIEGEDIIDPTRHLLKEGKIIKIANKSKDPQDRYIYLFNDILLCCEKKRLLTASASYKVKLKLEVDGMKVSVLDSDNCRFIIEGKTKSIELQTNTEEDREDWMAALLSAIREMVRKKESFKTNDAVGDRSIIEDDDDEDGKFVPGKCEPRWIKDDETTMCMRCGTDFKLIKRRHHCRACGAVVCNKCSSFESSLQYDNSKMNKVCGKCYYTLKGDVEELKKMERRSLITELADEASFGSFLYLQKGGWVKYWVVVTDQDLYALKAPKDVRAVLTIPIKLYTVSDVDAGSLDKDNVFRLTNGTDRRMTYTFAAESREMKKRWITVLTNGLEELSSKSQTI